jgi:hypothetical protein
LAAAAPFGDTVLKLFDPLAASPSGEMPRKKRIGQAYQEQAMLQMLKSNIYVLVMALGVIASGGQIYAQSQDVIADFGACLAINPPADCKNIMPK